MDFAGHVDRVRRLHLLFQNDGLLLDINTGLHHPNPPVLELSQAKELSAAGPVSATEAAAVCLIQRPDKMASSEDSGSVGETEAASIKQTAAPEDQDTPAGGTETASINEAAAKLSISYCPIMAVSRYPYKEIKGELGQRIGSRFFDDGKFWNRPWNLHYVPVPEYVSYRPLIVVPAFQVQLLFEDISDAFNIDLSLRNKCPRSLILPFEEDDTPQPVYLGESNSREEKDYFISLAPTEPLPVDRPGAGKLMAAYREKVQAGYAATKSKKRPSKTTRTQNRLRSELASEKFLDHIQSHLGLKDVPASDPSAGDIIDKENLECADQKTSIFDLNQPPYFSMWKEPIIMSIDVEWNERCSYQVTEIGVSALDTLDLIGLPPGTEGANWSERIRTRHFRVREYSNVVNSQFVLGCPDKFEFGESEWVFLADLVGVVESCFKPPYFSRARFLDVSEDESDGGVPLTDVHESEGTRNIIIVGHGLPNDISHLRALGITLFNKTETGPTVLETVDTSHLFKAWHRDPQPRSLTHILAEFGMVAWNLHNAGNDSRYVLEVLVRIALKVREAADKKSAAAHVPTAATSSSNVAKAKEEEWL